MKLSVVLPCYNDEKTIKPCLESLQKQTLTRKEYEIIVADDGSTDSTLEIARKFKHLRILASRHFGRSANRNRGWKAARAGIVFFAESDAVYSENFLKECLSFFKDWNVGGVIGKLEAWNLESAWVKCRAAELNSRFEGSYKPFTAWMFRKKVLQELGGFDVGLEIGEDADLGKRVLGKDWKIAYARKAVWKHFEPPAILKVWKRFWLRGREMPKYYKKNGFPKKVLFLDAAAFATVPLGFFYSPLWLVFAAFALVQVLMRISYFGKIRKKYWPHLLFYLFSTMIVSKLARLYGLFREELK